MLRDFIVSALSKVCEGFVMKKSDAIQWKTGCWILVGSFTAASAWFSWSMHQLFTHLAQPGSSGLMCGNSVTDPLGLILSLAPFSFAGVAGFVFLRSRRAAGWLPVLASAGLTLICTVALLIFGFRFFRDSLPGLYLYEIVWWLKPIEIARIFVIFTLFFIYEFLRQRFSKRDARNGACIQQRSI